MCFVYREACPVMKTDVIGKSRSKMLKGDTGRYVKKISGRKGNKINNGKIKLQETFLPFHKLWELTTVLPERKCVLVILYQFSYLH